MIEKLGRAFKILRTKGPGQLIGSARNSLGWKVKMRRQRMRTWPQYWYRLRYRGAAPDPYPLLEVSPAEIEFLVSPHFQDDFPPDGTYIVGGEWDQRTADAELNFVNAYEGVFDRRKLVPLGQYVFYRSVENHVRRGTPWDETEFYQWTTSFDEFPDDTLYGDEEMREWRFEQLDRLIDSIQTEGYRSQRECRRTGTVVSGQERVGRAVSHLAHSADVPPEFHEIMINIGRDGRLFFEEGRHRFAVSRALELDSIPVRVFVRHAEWQRKRSEVAAASALSDLREETRELLSHPDLTALKSF